MNSLSSDSIANDDLLGRNKFAKQIVNSLMQVFKRQEESIVIGIAGKWGSGKSTLLSFIENHLHNAYNRNKDQYRIIRFNPWASSTLETEALHRNLLETVINELEKINWKRKIKDTDNKLKKYAKYLQHLKYLKYIHPVAEKFSDIVEEYSKKVSVLSLEEVKAQADELIKDKEIKLYIFLDDLDRLTPEEIASIFRVVKLNLNFVHTYFLIAYDKQVVIESLKKVTPNPESYLEKIIQVDFTIPEILEEQLQAIFFSRLSDLFHSIDLKLEEQNLQTIWKYHGLRQYFHTFRDMNRYFNSLVFSLPNIGAEVNINDFLVLEAIKVFDYSGYEKIYHDFLQKRREAVWKSSSFDESTINEYANPTTKALLRFLVPQNRNELMLTNTMGQKRLHDPEYFNRYYTLYIPSQDITEETLNRFLIVGQNRQQVLLEVANLGKMINLLRRLGDPNLKKSYSIDQPYLFDSILRFWNEHEYDLTESTYEYIWQAYFNLAHCFTDPYNGAKEAIGALVLHENSGQALKFVFNHYIHLYLEEGSRNSYIYGDIEKQIQVALSTLTEKFIEYLNRNWSSYIYRGIRNTNTFLSDLFIDSWAKYCPEGYSKEIGRFLEDYSFAIYFLKSQFLSISVGVRKPFRINLRNQESLVPGKHWETFLNTLKTAPKGIWSEEDQECVDYFLQSLATDVSG
jgi:hypothetical protein